MKRSRRVAHKATKQTLEAEIAQLRDLDLKGLRLRWQSMFRRQAHSHLPRHLLLAVMAYQLQPKSKQARVIAMLRAPGGATIQALTRITGWQSHSIRGFLAGVVRKKLGLNLVSTAADRGRVYRIADRTTARTESAS